MHRMRVNSTLARGVLQYKKQMSESWKGNIVHKPESLPGEIMMELKDNGVRSSRQYQDNGVRS